MIFDNIELQKITSLSSGAKVNLRALYFNAVKIKSMTIKYQNRDFLGFQAYIDRQPVAGMSGVDSTPLYAHPIDEGIIRTLNATPVKAVINKAIDSMVSFQFGHNLARGIFITQKSFPDLFEVLSHCAKTLGIPIPHAVAEHREDSLFNAFTAGTDEYAFIVISSTLCQYFTKEEACFVIGHECAHIAAGHIVYHTLAQVLTGAITPYLGFIGDILRATAGVPLLAWSRRSEITADRAGLLCCGDIAVAEQALLRLVTGLADVDRVDIDDYLHRYKGVEKFHEASNKFNELLASHPQIPKRIEALRLFANSELYYSLSGKPKPTDEVLLTQGKN